MTPHPFDVPPDIIFAAEKVGRWFEERNIKDWECGPCKARFSAAHCSAPERKAGTDGLKAGPLAYSGDAAACVICGRKIAHQHTYRNGQYS